MRSMHTHYVTYLVFSYGSCFEYTGTEIAYKNINAWYTDIAYKFSRV